MNGKRAKRLRRLARAEQRALLFTHWCVYGYRKFTELRWNPTTDRHEHVTYGCVELHPHCGKAIYRRLKGKRLVAKTGAEHQA